MNAATRVQILDEADCISHNINSLQKDMKPSIIYLNMGKEYRRLGPIILVW